MLGYQIHLMIISVALHSSIVSNESVHIDCFLSISDGHT